VTGGTVSTARRRCYRAALRPALARTLAEHKGRGLTWVLLKPSLGNLSDDSPKAAAVRDAFGIRQKLSSGRGERSLQRLGIRLERLARH
jgi:hypothetical protein